MAEREYDYDKGGDLPPSLTVRNETGKPERILASEQMRQLLDYMREKYGDG